MDEVVAAIYLPPGAFIIRKRNLGPIAESCPNMEKQKKIFVQEKNFVKEKNLSSYFELRIPDLSIFLNKYKLNR